MTLIKGAKAGEKKPRVPVESPDDLQSVAKAKLLLALGEGEFAGGLDAKNIFLDGTPIENVDGSRNFDGVRFDFRPGTQAQTHIPGMPGSENEVGVNSEVSSRAAWTKNFTHSQLSAVRLRIKWPALYIQHDNGDLTGNAVWYKIAIRTDGGSWHDVFSGSVTGKTTTGYERSHRIDLPAGATSWDVRLTKLSPDEPLPKFANQMLLESYTEVIDAKLRYPNTALLYVEFDSQTFGGSLPQIACEPRGRVIRVPDVYDPETRQYHGIWEGNFKWAWTDNPAWIFYDLVVSDRFGLGHRLSAANIDKWSLYQVAQYCDQPVPDGKGGNGTEPRYTCNVYIQSRADAYTVLRDMAAIFRGMTYWGGDQIVALADMPRDVDYLYTRANVINGKFTYASSSDKTRYSTALVSWCDPAIGYADAMEPVFESDRVARYGVNQLEITAIGCTRQSEANRKGRWGILTSQQDRVVTFSVGLDGAIPQPGYVIAVADELLSGRVTGGRIRAVSGSDRVIALDRVPDAKTGDRLSLNLPSGRSQYRTIQAVNGTVITVVAPYSETPQPDAVWAVESSELVAQQYRVTTVTDNSDNTFTITAVYYDPGKYSRIDTGAVLDAPPISVIPPGHQAPPENITITAFSTVVQGISVQTMRASWDQTKNAVTYEAQWRRDNGNWVNVPRTSTTSFDVPGIYAGRYRVRVRAINAAEISSGWGYAQETLLTGKSGNPPMPLAFTATPINWGIRLNWGFPPNTGDTLKTVIQYAPTADAPDPRLLTDVPYPQRDYTQLGLKAGQTFWYRAQLVDKTGNESAWTTWIQGMANNNPNDYLGDIADGILTAEDGKRLTGDIDTNLEAAIHNALANNATVEHQYTLAGEVRADILQVKTTIAEVDKALAEMSTTVRAEIGKVSAAVEDKLTAVVDADGATAIHTLKTGVRINGVTYNAGMSIAVLAENNQPVVTRIGFNANQFVLLSGNGDKQYSPFAVVNGQVFISEAFIQDGAITNAKIGNDIQSNDYIEGARGWRMSKTGKLELNSALAGGGRSVFDSNGISVYDNHGVKRFSAGYRP